MAGYCAGYPTPGSTNPVSGGGFGLGRGRGFGRGFRRGFGRGFGKRGAGYPYADGNSYVGVSYTSEMTPQQEVSILKGQAKAMREEVEAIDARIKELEANLRS
jgi:hypothetical protein